MADDTIRPVRVRALKDCESITHHMTKGKEYELASDHAKALEEQGLVEVMQAPERAVRSGAEKRG